MKEIKVTCPECDKETIYYRDNARFYSILALVITFSWAFGFLMGNIN